jgi:hypothetical protein
VLDEHLCSPSDVSPAASVDRVIVAQYVALLLVARGDQTPQILT